MGEFSQNTDANEQLVKNKTEINALKEANKKLENETSSSANTNMALSDENNNLTTTNQTLTSQIDAFAKQAKACQEIKVKLHIK